MTGPQLSRTAQAAAELTGLADWIDGELAAGQPPKWVAQVAAKAARYIAARLRAGGAR